MRDAIESMDAAILARDHSAWAEAERLLPPTCGPEPAVVDRLVTLRLLEGDPATALAALGSIAEEGARWDLLRAIALVAMEDVDELHRHLDSSVDGSGDRPCLALIDTALSCLSTSDRSYRQCGDPTSSYCAALASGCVAGPDPLSGARLLALAESAIHEVTRLLHASAHPRSLAMRLLACIHGMARDLGIAIDDGGDPSSLAVSPRDRIELRLRAA